MLYDGSCTFGQAGGFQEGHVQSAQVRGHQGCPHSLQPQGKFQILFHATFLLPHLTLPDLPSFQITRAVVRTNCLKYIHT